MTDDRELRGLCRACTYWFFVPRSRIPNGQIYCPACGTEASQFERRDHAEEPAPEGV